MLNKFEEKNIKITKIYYCPHHPLHSNIELSNCKCRKPKPGLFLKASKDFNIEMNKSIAIGDRERDLIAAKNAGIKKRYLITQDNLFPNKQLVTSSYRSVLECANFLREDKNN